MTPHNGRWFTIYCNISMQWKNMHWKLVMMLWIFFPSNIEKKNSQMILVHNIVFMSLKLLIWPFAWCFLISTHLINFKIEFACMFALNFHTIFLVIIIWIEVMIYLDVHHEDKMFRNNMFFKRSIPTQHGIFPFFFPKKQKASLAPHLMIVFSQQ
jgi:hypothetical protein